MVFSLQLSGKKRNRSGIDMKDILLEMEMRAEEKKDKREEKMLKLEQEMEEKRRERELEHATKMQALLGNFLQQFTSMCGSLLQSVQPSPYPAYYTDPA